MLDLYEFTISQPIEIPNVSKRAQESLILIGKYGEDKQ